MLYPTPDPDGVLVTASECHSQGRFQTLIQCLFLPYSYYSKISFRLLLYEENNSITHSPARM
jgi:hypothetical protein